MKKGRWPLDRVERLRLEHSVSVAGFYPDGWIPIGRLGDEVWRGVDRSLIQDPRAQVVGGFIMQPKSNRGRMW